MSDIVSTTRQELERLSSERRLNTADVRKTSAKLFRALEDRSSASVFHLCEKLLEERNWAMGVIAYDWAFRVRKHYDEDTFEVFESWLKKYVRDWGDCDDFCTHAFGELLAQKNELFKRVIPWTQSPDFWVRRASAVILIRPIHHDRYAETSPFLISDRLMNDDHYLVQKGYGWMLKELSVRETGKVYDYLLKNRKVMPRTAYRYGLEKMDRSLKAELMKKDQD